MSCPHSTKLSVTFAKILIPSGLKPSTIDPRCGRRKARPTPIPSSSKPWRKNSRSSRSRATLIVRKFAGTLETAWVSAPASRTPPPPIHLIILHLADMTKPVYRHLAEKKWRNDGDLDLLVSGASLTMHTSPDCVQMERIHQMNVVPDVLPSLHPSFDLRLTFPEPPPQSVYLRTRSKRQHKQVEPGVFLVSEQVRQCNMFSLFSPRCS